MATPPGPNQFHRLQVYRRLHRGPPAQHIGDRKINVQSEVKTADNGVNVAALMGAREALAAAPEVAKFTWRAESQWMGGVHSRATMNGFFGLGEEHIHKKP